MGRNRINTDENKNYVGVILDKEIYGAMLGAIEKFETKSAFLKKAILREIESRKNNKI